MKSRIRLQDSGFGTLHSGTAVTSCQRALTRLQPAAGPDVPPSSCILTSCILTSRILIPASGLQT